MKRIAFILLFLGLSVATRGYAEETAVVPESPASTEAAVPAAVAAVPAPAMDVAPAAADEEANTDNLEFISGEVGELDEAGKTLTVKLYGETESAATDKTLKVLVDASTDITDGEQDRDFKSLSVGTEVDVEYDPATNKATYIFVY